MWESYNSSLFLTGDELFEYSELLEYSKLYKYSEYFSCYVIFKLLDVSGDLTKCQVVTIFRQFTTRQVVTLFRIFTQLQPLSEYSEYSLLNHDYYIIYPET